MALSCISVGEGHLLSLLLFHPLSCNHVNAKPQYIWNKHTSFFDRSLHHRLPDFFHHGENHVFRNHAFSSYTHERQFSTFNKDRASNTAFGGNELLPSIGFPPPTLAAPRQQEGTLNGFCAFFIGDMQVTAIGADNTG